MQATQSAREGQQRLDSKVSVVSETAGLISDANRLEVIYKRISRRVLLLFVIAVILNHIDRTNLAYAAITFNRCGPITSVALYGSPAADAVAAVSLACNNSTQRVSDSMAWHVYNSFAAETWALGLRLMVRPCLPQTLLC
jgi:hypothetical protein